MDGDNMKRIKKGISLFFIAFLTLIFLFPNARAQTNQTNIISTNDTANLTVGDLSFSNITFQDNSSSSSLAFGLTADVTNASLNDIYYEAISYYYDSNNNLIATASSNSFAVSDKSKLNFMSNLNILGNNDVQDIKYYRLEINIDNSTSTNTNTTPSEIDLYDSHDYVIDKYDVNIVVNEDNTFDITETITAYFNMAKHGIYRKIPLKNKIVRLDGTSSTNRAKISNLSVDNKYKVSQSGDVYNIQIGDADKTVTGKQTYTIKYTYNIGKDPVKDYDELYYNIIGDEWDTVIGNITFSITMPKKFDSSKLGFSSGTTGSTANNNIIYNVSGNTITGSYTKILSPGNALTIRAELPEGYFAKASNIFTLQDFLIFFVPIVGLIISAILWFIYGRDDKVVETVEFYPPEDFNSLEVGFLYKGKADNIDVTSLIIYLANKGYIQITETDEGSLFSKGQNYKITKLKDYDGNDANERLFLGKIFKSSKKKKSSNCNEVALSELYNEFYPTVNKILKKVNSKKNKEKIFEKTSLNKKKYVIIMMVISYILITAIPIINYSGLDTFFWALLFPVIFFVSLFNVIFVNKSIFTSIYNLICGVLLGGIPWLRFVLPVLLKNNIYLIGYLCGLICLFVMFVCLKYLPKRTSYGLEMLGKIKGFKTYLETAEKDKLEAMVMENPNYFYDILPYTYVLGVSDKWIKKFETITMQAPNWYVGTRPFSVVTFGTSLNRAMSKASHVMSSYPSSSSGSSGGGSSGGGSGGGGGGSW